MSVQAFVFIGDTELGKGISENLVAAGYRAAPDLSQADAVFTFCTVQDELEDVYFDGDGVIAEAKKGAMLVDLSPSTASFARELSAVATVSDLHAVDAPVFAFDVMASDAFSDAGNLLLSVGAEEDDFKAIAPMLEAVGESVERCGAPGSGQLARAALALQDVAQIVGFVEADALCRATADGDAAQRMHDLSLSCSVAAPRLRPVAEAIREQNFDGACTIRYLMASITAALMCADDIDLILPQAEASMHLLELLAVIGGLDKAPSALSLVYGDESACAANGLDWTRAEETYGQSDSHDDGCGCGHDHGDDDIPEEFGGYSAN